MLTDRLTSDSSNQFQFLFKETGLLSLHICVILRLKFLFQLKLFWL